MAYSNNSGGTLTLPSPTHVHHVDMSSAVRSLRRSLSRSPSKFHLVRAASQGLESPTGSKQAASLPESSFSGSGQTKDAAAPPTSASALSSTPTPTSTSQQQTPFATPLRSNVKLSLRSARPKAYSAKPLSRARVSPKSPLKRALSNTPDSGNLVPPSESTPETFPGQENGSFNSFALAFSPAPRSLTEKPSRHSMHLDVSGSSKMAPTKFLDVKIDPLPPPTVSPLKRSDAIMNFDQTSFGSPVAKRRSLHGISSAFPTDFNVFDHGPPPQINFDIHEDNDREYQLTSSMYALPREQSPFPTPPALPKRSSSLRKSTLQQRHDPRSSWGRRQGEKYLAQQATTVENTPPSVRNKPRASLDQFLLPDPRESPFTMRGPLPNPSAHLMERLGHQPHPLSRTLTTSSSGSSMPDESPTHFPVQNPDRPRHPGIFSRSLPIGAQPPPEPVATPQYKSAKPLQSVFASTGLVSKMNRNPEQDPAQRGGPGRQLIMPDTPCKKQVYPSNTYPPSSGSGGRKQQRFSLPAPETPFRTAPSLPRGTFGGYDQQVGGLFKFRSSHARRASLLSADGDATDAFGVTESDFPPTPTKSALAKKYGSAGEIHATPVPIRNLPAPVSAVGPGMGGQAALLSCKFSSLKKSPVRGVRPRRATQIGQPSTPSAAMRGISTSMPSFDQSRASRAYVLPHTPVMAEATVETFPSHHAMIEVTKSESTVAASPLDRLGSEKESPKTPIEAMAPPDPSCLSISNGNSKLDHPPATPTASRDGRDGYGGLIDRRLSITPVNGQSPNDVDEVLRSRFDKVEPVGRGEFSQVFRVTTRASTAGFDYFCSTPSKRAGSSTVVQAYAVKRTRLPYYGEKERAARMREVTVLEALRGRENVLQIVDHWEKNNHLYIQTEYCDEGSLDGFLKKVGERGRLDDFRIWKIMLEMCQGLRFVHDAGFIHLDLKPANVFITYEGNLKIGDFGMAAEWPAPRGTDGEGDREYMGPEILRGQFDKPADVFAMGLIILEIACNVFLPDNGPIWLALREGDLSVVSSLTSSESSTTVRDATGMPITGEGSISEQRSADTSFGASPGSSTDKAGSIFGASQKFDLETPPDFMVDQYHPGSLDSVVSRLINPDPMMRPTVHEILQMDSVQWVHNRRRAPATVYEGNWGPADRMLGSFLGSMVEFDTEMTDV